MNGERSVTDQLRDAVRLCNDEGYYDAADWIDARLRSDWSHLTKTAAGGIVDDAAVAPGEGTGRVDGM